MTLATLALLGLFLTLTFGFSLGYYLSSYVFRFSARGAVVSATILLGTTIGSITFIFMLFAVWPPAFPI